MAKTNKATIDALTALSRADLEAAYIASVPSLYRDSTATLITSYSVEYMIARLAPQPKARRGQITRTRGCLDNGAS